MSSRIALIGLGVIVGIAALVLLSRAPEKHAADTPSQPASSPRTPNAGEASSTIESDSQPPSPDEAQVVDASAEVVEDEPVAQTNDKVFKTDAAGRLVIDAHTRLNLEALIARTPPEQLAAAKQEASGALPPDAAAKAVDLIDRYAEYDVAHRQSYPPGRAPSTEEEGLAELEGLSALRKAHFGEEIAGAFYAEEEALNRRLLERMKLEKDGSLTLEEKAHRAQQALD